MPRPQVTRAIIQDAAREAMPASVRPYAATASDAMLPETEAGMKVPDRPTGHSPHGGVRPSSSSLSAWAFSFLPISLDLDVEGRPRGRLEDWLARVGSTHRVALKNVCIAPLVGVALLYLADAPLGPTLPLAADRRAIAITGIVFLGAVAAILALTHFSYLRLRAAVLPSAAVAPQDFETEFNLVVTLSGGTPDASDRRTSRSRVGRGKRSSSSLGSLNSLFGEPLLDDLTEGASCAPIPAATQRLFVFGGLLSSQVAIVLLLSQWARLLGLQRNTITLTQVLIVGCDTWASLLQRADHGLVASVVMWAHHIVVVATAVHVVDSLDFIYYILTLCWYASLWFASRNRDRYAIDDGALEFKAAAQAAKCRTLVNALLPPAIIVAIREKLVVGSLPSVAFDFKGVVLLQSDIVVRTPGSVWFFLFFLCFRFLFRGCAEAPS